MERVDGVHRDLRRRHAGAPPGDRHARAQRRAVPGAHAGHGALWAVQLRPRQAAGDRRLDGVAGLQRGVPHAALPGAEGAGAAQGRLPDAAHRPHGDLLVRQEAANELLAVHVDGVDALQRHLWRPILQEPWHRRGEVAGGLQARLPGAGGCGAHGGEVRQVRQVRRGDCAARAHDHDQRQDDGAWPRGPRLPKGDPGLWATALHGRGGLRVPWPRALGPTTLALNQNPGCRSGPPGRCALGSVSWAPRSDRGRSSRRVAAAWGPAWP